MDSFQLSPGVIIDPNRGEAYLMGPAGDIVAVELANGSEVWRSQEAAKPLSVAGDILVGQAEQPGPANALRIVALSTSSQGRRITEGLVPLPPNVQPAIDQAAHRSFIAKSFPQAGAATLSWEFVERPLRGMAPGPHQVLPGEAAPVPSAADVAAIAAPAVAMAGPVAQQPTVMRGTVQFDLSSGAVAPTVAPHLATLAAAAPVGPAADVVAGAGIAGVPEPQFLSADGRHILSSKRIADDPEWDKYLWTLYDLDSKAPVGTFKMHLRYAPFFVSGTRVIFQTPPYARRQGGQLVEEPPQIHAMDMAASEQLWNHPVRDTTDRRPRPP